MQGVIKKVYKVIKTSTKPLQNMQKNVMISN